MILADTNIVIRGLRRSDPKFHALFDSLAIASCGPIRAEVLTGVRSAVERSKTLSIVNPLPTFLISNAEWDFIGDLRAFPETKGYCLSLTDVAIGGVAILNDIELWSRDKAHVLMASVIPALRHFAELP